MAKRRVLAMDPGKINWAYAIIEFDDSKQPEFVIRTGFLKVPQSIETMNWYLGILEDNKAILDAEYDYVVAERFISTGRTIRGGTAEIVNLTLGYLSLWFQSKQISMRLVANNVWKRFWGARKVDWEKWGRTIHESDATGIGLHAIHLDTNFPLTWIADFAKHVSIEAEGDKPKRKSTRKRRKKGTSSKRRVKSNSNKKKSS